MQTRKPVYWALWLWAALGCTAGCGGQDYDPGETTASLCTDDLDNDGDGRTDCDDDDCLGFSFCQTAPEDDAVQCQDGTDNDGDGATDCDDRDCSGLVVCTPPTEQTASACQDGEDNDEDGTTDCDDPDCAGFVFCQAPREDTADACGDGVDNDQDGDTDCDDPDCRGFVFCQEQEISSADCQDGADNDGDGLTDCQDPDCGGFVFCQQLEISSAACQDGADNDDDGLTDCDDPDCSGFVFCLSEEGTSTACQDGADNDDDGLTDCNDPDCQGFVFCQSDETSAATCQDGQDNDDDGLTDCSDPDCMGFVFCWSGESTSGSCQDGVDNDDDGATDCEDTDCQGFLFCMPPEENTSDTCNDGVDNDGDGDTDCEDTGCAGFVFCLEPTEETATACEDGLDNDDDGLTDCDDPGCRGFVFCLDDETSAGTCQDGTDNDQDGLTDCDDPDCQGFTFCWTGTGESTWEDCQDGADNDGDGNVDCDDQGCWPWGFCQHYQGYPVVDAWGDTWDGIERPADSWEHARSICTSLQGRLPTATELWRNNATTGTADLTGTTATSHLWTILHHHLTGKRVTVRLSDGEVGDMDADMSMRFRCVWPRSDGAGFDLDECHGSPAGACFGFDHVWNVDTQDRVPLDYVAATDECAVHGASIPSSADWSRLIHAGLPNASNDWLWTGQAMYWYSEGYGMAIIRWTDDASARWQYQNPAWGEVSWGNDPHAFRCIGLADPAAHQVPAPVCQGGCRRFEARRSVMIADGADRTAANLSAAIAQCRVDGGTLPSASDATELLHAGWTQGSGNWIWLADAMHWYSGNYGNPTARWSGDGDPHYQYIAGKGSLSTPSASLPHRCVWHQRGPSLPGCQDDQVVLWTGDGYTCQAGAEGDSNGLAYGFEFIDDFGNAWDGVQRPAAVDFTYAESYCENHGGRLPTASEVYAVRYAGNPHTSIGDNNTTDPIWTVTRTSAEDLRVAIRVSDGQAVMLNGTTDQRFRCVWPAAHSDVLAQDTCYGPPGDACFATADGLFADKYDRVALDVAGAINECMRAGGRLPDYQEVVRLIHDGWSNPSDQWNWMGEYMYWHDGNYGHARFRWTEANHADWEFVSGNAGVNLPTAFHHFRCVYATPLR